MEKNSKVNGLTDDAPFGYCPFCGSPLKWDSDSSWEEDEDITIRFLTCDTCGASVEAIQCPKEERVNYQEYWNEHG